MPNHYHLVLHADSNENERIHGVASGEEPLQDKSSTKPLLGFVGDEHQSSPKGIAYSLIDYLELLDWTGRILREDKGGAICAQRPRLLTMLGLEDESWFELACGFGKNYLGAVGSLEELALFASHTGKCWIARKTLCGDVYINLFIELSL